METGLLTGLELTTLFGQQAPGIAGLCNSVFVSQCWDYKWVLLYLASYTGTGTNSGPHMCVTMLFTNGAIFLAQSWVTLGGLFLESWLPGEDDNGSHTGRVYGLTITVSLTGSRITQQTNYLGRLQGII